MSDIRPAGGLTLGLTLGKGGPLEDMFPIGVLIPRNSLLAENGDNLATEDDDFIITEQE